MSCGILIIARLGSQRLTEKHLRPAGGKPLLHYLIERVRRAFPAELANHSVQILIATSDEPANRRFEDFTDDAVSVFYGSISNIPRRLLEAAAARGFSSIIAVDGDDILCSTAGIRAVQKALENGAAYASTEGLPFGMNSSGYSTAFLESSLSRSAHQTLETGWGKIFDAAALEKLAFPEAPQSKLLRFTLDYEEDFRFFNAIVEHFGSGIYDASDTAIVDTVLAHKFYELNLSVHEKYWKNFEEQKSKE